MQHDARRDEATRGDATRRDTTKCSRLESHLPRWNAVRCTRALASSGRQRRLRSFERPRKHRTCLRQHVRDRRCRIKPGAADASTKDPPCRGHPGPSLRGRLLAPRNFQPSEENTLTKGPGQDTKPPAENTVILILITVINYDYCNCYCHLELAQTGRIPSRHAARPPTAVTSARAGLAGAGPGPGGYRKEEACRAPGQSAS